MKNLSDQEFIQICNSASSMAEAQRLTGLQFTTFKVRATNLGCYNSDKGKARKDVFQVKKNYLKYLMESIQHFNRLN